MDIMNISGLGLCALAIIMLMAAFTKGKKNEHKARRAAKKGL